MKTINYFDTFIQVADDCPVNAAEVPPQKDDGVTIVRLQFEMVYYHPYVYTSDDVVFHVFTQRNRVPTEAQEKERIKFFFEGATMFSDFSSRQTVWLGHP